MNDRPPQTPNNRDATRRRAQNHFQLAEERTALVKRMMDEERRATDAKTLKLRALRLAKEEEDRAAGKDLPAPAPKRRAKARAAN